MRKRMFLQLFEDGGGAGSGGQGGNAGDDNGSQGNAGGNATYSYAQAEEIAQARAERAEKSALKSYFQQQGMSEEQVTQAIADYKEQKKKSQPDTARLQQERDDALNKVQQMENEKLLTAKGVKQNDLDYVMFKVSKMVDDKTTFDKAAEKYLKENPQYAGGSASYRMTSSSGGNSNGSGGNINASINDAIRAAARR